MPPLSVLVSGAGISGPVLAFFLARSGISVTVIERAPAVRTGGQNVDVRGHALKILQYMNVEDEIKKKSTHEKGLRFVDSDNVSWADFPVADGTGFTSELEIMRGDLGNVLYEASKDVPGVEYVFGESISALSEDAHGVTVDFENGMPTRQFDIVVAADGWASRTRKLAFGADDSRTAVKDLGQWAAWYTIPHAPSDSDWARWYNAPGKRMILLRPDNAERSRVSLWIMPKDDVLDKARKLDMSQQKATWARIFADAGWESERVIEAMENADDFYMQKVVQIKLPTWSKGRVVLAGDAGYCPSPISGMGVTTAVVGAYCLAGEIAKSQADIPAAFQAYETRMNKFVDIAQKLAPGAPSMANPDSWWGIRALHMFLGFVAWTGLQNKMGSSFNPPSQAMELPAYDFAKV
jgi:2-polyprenyl-6-methoxyphenol hydroxylase-like FAD-dependent oxidoreductase